MIFSDDFNKKRDNYEQSLGNKKDSPNNFFIQVARQATQPLANASPQVSAVSKAVNSNQNNSKNATYMNPLGKSQANNVNGYTAEIPKFINKYVGTKDTPNQRVQVAGPNRQHMNSGYAFSPGNFIIHNKFTGSNMKAGNYSAGVSKIATNGVSSERAVINTPKNKYRDMSIFEIIDEMDRIDGSSNLKLPEKVRSVSAREAAKRNNESADKGLAERSHINDIFNGVNAVPNLSYMDGATYSIPREEMIVTPKKFMDGIGRTVKGFSGVRKKTEAVPFIAYETGKTSIENAFSNMRNEEYSKLYDEIARQDAELGRYKDFVYNSLDELEGDGRYMNLVKDSINTRLEFEKEKAKKSVDPDSFGMKLYTEGQKDIVDALNGLDGSNLALAKTVFGVGESIPVMAASVVNPYLGVTVSGMKTSADKMYELNMAGVPAGESFRRGAAVGAIDAGASYLPSKYFHGTVRGQGKSLADSALRQANVTALEELTNYIGNYLEDAAFGDPKAAFDVVEALNRLGTGYVTGVAWGTLGHLAGGLFKGKALKERDKNIAQFFEEDTAEIVAKRGDLIEGLRAMEGNEYAHSLADSIEELHGKTSRVDEFGVEGYNKGKSLQNNERTLRGYVFRNVLPNSELSLYTKSPGFNNNGKGFGGAFKRYGVGTHGGISPHVHRPVRNVAPDGRVYGTTGHQTNNNDVGYPNTKDIKQLYEYYNNGKYH